MKIKFSLFLLLAAVTLGCVNTFGQCDSAQVSDTRTRPSPTYPVNYGDMELFIDHALLVAHECRSNLIVIVKMEKNTTLSLAKLRMKRVGDYLRFRGFKDFEVAVNFDAGGPGQIELYVSGKRLYSLPLKKKDKLVPPGI